MAATNAAGTTTVRYGKTRANILALEAVLADGRIIHTGTRAAKTSAGYDLTSLLVGSEGTLAVITEVTVRLHPILEHTVSLRISFPDVESACRTAAAVVAAGAGSDADRTARRVELAGDQRLPRHRPIPRGPCLFVEASGSDALVEGDLELVQAIARDEGATAIVHERDPDARARLWGPDTTSPMRSRRASRARERTTDICVPLSELAAAVPFARGEIDRLGLDAGILGHAGDGNLHVAVQVPPEPAEIARSDELVRNVVDDALARGGTCTGEHGIGLGKIGALEQEHGDLIPLMRAIKQAFDPDGILNPGKVLRAAPGAK